MTTNESQSPAPAPGRAKQPMTDAQRSTNRIVTILGFVFAFIAVLDIAGLVLSLVALIRSRRAGERNGLALAGVIVSIVGIIVGVALIAVVLTFGITALVDAAQMCERLGDGEHVVGDSVYTCTPTSFSVRTRP